MAQNTIRILYLCAAPPGEVRLAFDREVLEISKAVLEETVRRPPDADRLQLQPIYDVSPQEIQRHLIHYRPTIVHFAAHGEKRMKNVTFDVGAVRGRLLRPPPATPAADNEAALVLGNGAGGRAAVAQDALATVLANYKSSVKCVVLNACSSRSIADEIVAHIDCAVGTSDAVSDDAAIAFAQTFYAALAAGESFRKAADNAKAAPALENELTAVFDLVTREGIDSSVISVVSASPLEEPGGPFLRLDTLRSILARIDARHWALVFQALQRVCPNRPFPPKIAGYPSQIVSDLASLPPPTTAFKLHPLLHFVRLLSLDQVPPPLAPVDAPVRRDLAGWIALQLVDPRNQLLPGLLREEDWQPKDRHLHISIAPVAKGSDRYNLEAWLDDNNLNDANERERQNLDSDAVARQLALLFADAAASVERKELLVELFLPDDRMLDWPLDQIVYTDAVLDEKATIGRECRVVARFQRRHAVPVLRQRLSSAWSRLRTLFEGADPLSAREYVDGVAIPVPTAIVRFNVTPNDSEGCLTALKNSGTVCVVLENDAVTNAFRTELLCAGIPIVIWARPKALAEDRRTLATLVSADQPLRNLPARVQQRRKERGLGDHLSLVWDDADDLLDAQLPGLARKR